MKKEIFILILSLVLTMNLISANPTIIEDNECIDLNNNTLCFYYSTFTHDIITPSGKYITSFNFRVHWEIINLNGEIIDHGKYSQKINENDKTSIMILNRLVSFNETGIDKFFREIMKIKDGEIQFIKSRFS